jgi:predicted transcriptional regulator
MSGDELDLTAWTADIVAAYVAHNVLSAEKLPEFIGAVHQALSQAAAYEIEPPKDELIPAVPVKKSITNDYLICLEDGKKFKSLKRHLKSDYDLSPEAYREKWGLPRDYPMVAPAYAAARSDLAKTMGLGRRKAAITPPAPAASSPATKKAAKTGTKRGSKAA